MYMNENYLIHSPNIAEKIYDFFRNPLNLTKFAINESLCES